MLSGADMLGSLDERLARADRDARAAQQEADALADRRDHARAAEAEALRALARLRLAALRDGKAIGQLDEAEQRVRALLAERGEALRTEDAALARRRADLEAAQAERDRRAALMRDAEAEQARLLAEARGRAQADAEWQRLRGVAEEAARIAGHAAQKAALAHQDLAAKGAPYMADPLFAYLWQRGWGTPRYQGGGLARMLDGWTARVARFEPARRDYALLSDLPARLDAHAARMGEEAGTAAEALAARERAIAGLPAEGGPLAPAQDALDMAEQALENARAATAEAEAKRNALAGGADDVMREAERRLEQALGAESLRALREAARRTPTPEDDAIVARLEAAAADRARAEQEMQTALASAEAARRRRAELESLRAEMRGRGWGQDRWDFRDGAAIGVLVGEVLRGTLSRDGFWDRMGRHRVPAPRRQDGGGVWGAPPSPWGGGARQAPGPWSLPDRDDGGGGGGGWGAAALAAAGSGPGAGWTAAAPGAAGSRRVAGSDRRYTGTSPRGLSVDSTKEERVSFTPGMRSRACMANSP